MDNLQVSRPWPISVPAAHRYGYYQWQSELPHDIAHVSTVLHLQWFYTFWPALIGSSLLSPSLFYASNTLPLSKSWSMRPATESVPHHDISIFLNLSNVTWGGGIHQLLLFLESLITVAMGWNSEEVLTMIGEKDLVKISFSMHFQDRSEQDSSNGSCSADLFFLSL